jgi:ferredoxin
MTNPESLLGSHGAAESDVISGPYSQTKNGLKVTLWVTEACIDCDISRENCPAVYRHADKGRTEIKPDADFFGELPRIQRALDQCPTTALGLRVEKA